MSRERSEKEKGRGFRKGRSGEGKGEEVERREEKKGQEKGRRKRPHLVLFRRN